MEVRFRSWSCLLREAKYADGNPALYLEDAETGERITNCTVNLPSEQLLEGEFAIKNYSENEGMFEALMKTGAFEHTTQIKVNYGTHEIEFPVVRFKNGMEVN